MTSTNKPNSKLINNREEALIALAAGVPITSTQITRNDDGKLRVTLSMTPCTVVIRGDGTWEVYWVRKDWEGAVR